MDHSLLERHPRDRGECLGAPKPCPVSAEQKQGNRNGAVGLGSVPCRQLHLQLVESSPLLPAADPRRSHQVGTHAHALSPWLQIEPTRKTFSVPAATPSAVLLKTKGFINKGTARSTPLGGHLWCRSRKLVSPSRFCFPEQVLFSPSTLCQAEAFCSFPPGGDAQLLGAGESSSRGRIRQEGTHTSQV